jgi:hypothetical protein
LKLVIIIDYEDREEQDDFPAGSGSGLFRPLLDRKQVMPSGLERREGICMVMVGGGDEVEHLFRKSRSLGMRRRFHVESQGKVVGNIHVL